MDVWDVQAKSPLECSSPLQALPRVDVSGDTASIEPMEDIDYVALVFSFGEEEGEEGEEVTVEEVTTEEMTAVELTVEVTVKEVEEVTVEEVEEVTVEDVEEVTVEEVEEVTVEEVEEVTV